MKQLLFIFLGGGTGSLMRYLFTISLNKFSESAFPWATFAINVLGCVLIGAFYSLSSRFQLGQDIRLLLTVGLCGGFTTFSTFGNESLQLLKSGLYLPFLLYTTGSILLGILGVMAGGWLCK